MRVLKFPKGLPCGVILLASLYATAQADITTGLVGWWKLDEGAGTTASDSSGNAHNGTLTSGATWATGKIGLFAVNLDGLSGALDTGSSTIVNNSINITIALWINLASPAYFGGIAVKSAAFDGGAAKYALTLYGGSQTSLAWIVNGDAVTSVVALPLGTWACLVASSSATERTISIDGTRETFAPATQPASSGSVWVFGAWDSTGVLAPLPAQIDEVRIFNRALSSGDSTEFCAYPSAAVIKHRISQSSQLVPWDHGSRLANSHR
jgi:hypothetical protein